MEYHKLDNIGTFYASTSSKPNPDIFRFTAIMSDSVDKTSLNKALRDTIKQYPSFNSSLKMGFFWYYLAEQEDIPEAEEERLPVCNRLDLYADDVLYRLNYYRNRINLEVSHILSDGRGTLEFFTCLIENYCSIKYKIKNLKTGPVASLLEREEDSFDKYYEKTSKVAKPKQKIYNFTGKKLKRNKTRFVYMHTSTEGVLKFSKENNTTLTVALAALYIKSIIKTMKYKNKGEVIRIAVPVDLRGYYYSKTTKNFFGMVHVDYVYQDENVSVEEIIKCIDEQLKDSLKKENINKRSNQMFGLVKNVVVRSIPLIIKNVGLRVIANFTEKMTTSNISNLGKFKFKKEVEDYIEGIELSTNTSGLQLVVCSYKDDLCISASSRFAKSNVLNYFVQELKALGLEVSIVTNGV